ncbi:hypothetical protein C1Y40_05590 [Mycobacterium talmoniae]|uniref:Uncharacterized protein n=1 Tax=Mycobacterium talmoniae TaxID=1858794 RepID=A0A2S8BC67_9MYCO|nr:hypothetical protein C1Y40_05590 [Mycobacterium talmoniae]
MASSIAAVMEAPPVRSTTTNSNPALRAPRVITHCIRPGCRLATTVVGTSLRARTTGSDAYEPRCHPSGCGAR